MYMCMVFDAEIGYRKKNTEKGSKKKINLKKTNFETHKKNEKNLKGRCKYKSKQNEETMKQKNRSKYVQKFSFLPMDFDDQMRQLHRKLYLYSFDSKRNRKNALKTNPLLLSDTEFSIYR